MHLQPAGQPFFFFFNLQLAIGTGFPSSIHGITEHSRARARARARNYRSDSIRLELRTTQTQNIIITSVYLTILK